MKIIVVSDSHRDGETLNEIVRKTNADLYLHAGDSLVDARSLHPFISVRGNCDSYPFDLIKIIEVGKYKVYMTHGHLFSKARMIKNAKAHGAQIVISGHTHVPSIEEIDGAFVINPGSVSYPRMDYSPTYIEIFLDDNIKINLVKV